MLPQDDLDSIFHICRGLSRNRTVISVELNAPWMPLETEKLLHDALADNYTLQRVSFKATSITDSASVVKTIMNRNVFFKKQQRFKSVKPATQEC